MKSVYQEREVGDLLTHIEDLGVYMVISKEQMKRYKKVTRYIYRVYCFKTGQFETHRDAVVNARFKLKLQGKQ
jgi:hypothetical protein